MEDRGIHFVSQHRLLHIDGKTWMYVDRIGDHYVLEDNTRIPDNDYAAFVVSTRIRTKSATTSEWHRLLAHAGNDTIQHLESAAEGVEVVDSAISPKMNTHIFDAIRHPSITRAELILRLRDSCHDCMLMGNAKMTPVDEKPMLWGPEQLEWDVLKVVDQYRHDCGLIQPGIIAAWKMNFDNLTIFALNFA
ncbi:MAG: hypothetical protein OHK93_004665 [Ramalina farinacea]|uniref:Uncharacterized protein n=1 Tax=Ramalina farinacea TaxID=258253 RepID=A0AA43QUW0_9LECA|nr:hypothetical protein [Ramalina farinacea]